ALALAVVGTTALSAVILGRTAGFVAWLAPLALALALSAAGALVLPHFLRGSLSPSRLRASGGLAAGRGPRARALGGRCARASTLPARLPEPVAPTGDRRPCGGQRSAGRAGGTGVLLA